jgi:hypothetical protein
MIVIVRLIVVGGPKITKILIISNDIIKIELIICEKNTTSATI